MREWRLTEVYNAVEPIHCDSSRYLLGRTKLSRRKAEENGDVRLVLLKVTVGLHYPYLTEVVLKSLLK